jgi:hypothetical protein
MQNFEVKIHRSGSALDLGDQAEVDALQRCVSEYCENSMLFLVECVIVFPLRRLRMLVSMLSVPHIHRSEERTSATRFVGGDLHNNYRSKFSFCFRPQQHLH